MGWLLRVQPMPQNSIINFWIDCDSPWGVYINFPSAIMDAVMVFIATHQIGLYALLRQFVDILQGIFFVFKPYLHLLFLMITQGKAVQEGSMVVIIQQAADAYNIPTVATTQIFVKPDSAF